MDFAPGSATAMFYLTILDDYVAEPETKALHLQVYQTSDVISTDAVASMMVLIHDDEAASRTPPTFHAFGDAGLWTYSDAEGYRKINDTSPEAIYPAPKRGAYLDFGASGLWCWDALTGYEKLNAADAQGGLTSNQGESLLIDFGAAGLWRWSRADGFSQVTDVDPKALAGTAERGLVDFGPAGAWAFTTTGWEKLDDQSPEGILASGDDLYVDYGARGLWRVVSTQLWALSADDCAPIWRTSLQQINTADPTTMTPAWFGLLVGFGDAGLWTYDGGAGGWYRINDVAPRSITTGIGGFYLNYGEAGLWRWSNGGAWSKLHDLAPSTIAPAGAPTAAVPIEDFQVDVLDLDYGDAGLWRWTSTTGGWRRLSPGRVTALGVARNDTGVSYGIILA